MSGAREHPYSPREAIVSPKERPMRILTFLIAFAMASAASAQLSPLTTITAVPTSGYCGTNPQDEKPTNELYCADGPNAGVYSGMLFGEYVKSIGRDGTVTQQTGVRTEESFQLATGGGGPGAITDGSLTLQKFDTDTQGRINNSVKIADDPGSQTPNLNGKSLDFISVEESTTVSIDLPFRTAEEVETAIDNRQDNYRERITWDITFAAESDGLSPDPDVIGYANQIIQSTNGQVNVSFGTIAPSPPVLTIGDSSWRIINVEQIQHGPDVGDVKIRLGAPLDNGDPPTANAAAFPEGWDFQIGNLVLRRRDTSDEEYFPHAVASGQTSESVRGFIWDNVPAGTLVAGATTFQALGTGTDGLNTAEVDGRVALKTDPLDTRMTSAEGRLTAHEELNATQDSQISRLEELDTALRKTTSIAANVFITATDRNIGYAITGAESPTPDGTADHEIGYTIIPTGEDPITGVFNLSALRAKTTIVADGRAIGDTNAIRIRVGDDSYFFGRDTSEDMFFGSSEAGIRYALTLTDRRIDTTPYLRDQIPVARLGTGTADSTKVLYGDGAWKDAPTGGGGGVTLSDDAVLDLAQPTRVPADRNEYLGTSGTNENDLVLRALPNASATQTGLFDNNDFEKLRLIEAGATARPDSSRDQNGL